MDSATISFVPPEIGFARRSEKRPQYKTCAALFFKLNDVRQAFMTYDNPKMEYDNREWSTTKESVRECAGNEGFGGVI